MQTQSNTLKLKMVAGIALALSVGTIRRGDSFLINADQSDDYLSRTTIGGNDQPVAIFQVDTSNARVVLDLSTPTEVNLFGGQPGDDNATADGPVQTGPDDADDGTKAPAAPPSAPAKTSTQRQPRASTK